MRPLLLAIASCAIAALLSAGPAAAGPKSAWVDPPAKPDATPQAAGSAAKPEMSGKAKSDLAKSDPSKSDPSKSDPSKSDPSKSDSARSDTAKSAEPAPAKTAEKSAGRTARADAGSRRSRLAARHERHAHRPTASRGMAATMPAMRFDPSEDGADDRDPRMAGWAGEAQRLAGAYLDSISAPNAATLSQTPRFYASEVRFHGRTMTTAALIAEKQRFFRRWPERRYAARDGGMRTACNAASATCVVRAVMGFEADSPERGAHSRGVSELILTVSFAGPRPVIVAESSRVLSRGAAASRSVDRDPYGGA